MEKLSRRFPNAPHYWKPALHRRRHLFGVRDGLPPYQVQVLGTAQSSASEDLDPLEPSSHLLRRHRRVDIVRIC